MLSVVTASCKTRHFKVTQGRVCILWGSGVHALSRAPRQWHQQSRKSMITTLACKWLWDGKKVMEIHISKNTDIELWFHVAAPGLPWSLASLHKLWYNHCNDSKKKKCCIQDTGLIWQVAACGLFLPGGCVTRHLVHLVPCTLNSDHRTLHFTTQMTSP